MGGAGRGGAVAHTRRSNENYALVHIRKGSWASILLTKHFYFSFTFCTRLFSPVSAFLMCVAELDEGGKNGSREL
jgi:hypothetical protein